MDNNLIPKPEHRSSDQLYLDRLQFDPGLRKSLLNFFVTNFRVVVLMIMLLTAAGTYSFLELPRESNPEVKIPIAVIVTAYPGASPSDVEELITKKIETGISGLKNISKITSSSANSISTITVEYDAQADLDDSIRKLRDQVNSVKTNLPTDAKEPQVREISLDDTPIWTASLQGPYDGFTLRSAADDIKDELEKIPGVREVKISGGDTREFEVAYDPQKLTYYNLSADQANSTIKATNLAVPAGTFDGTKYAFPVRTDGRFYDAEKLGLIPLLHTDDGAIVYLKDVAQVSEKAIEKTVMSRFSAAGKTPGENVTLQIVKKTGGNIIETVDTAKARLDGMLKTLPQGMSYSEVVDQSSVIRKDFDHLTRDFLITIALVFLILFLIVGFKEAFVAGLAVPLVFFATFTVMYATGTSLNFLSMFSLILALGLLVDDAIVVVSATKQYLNSGKFTPEEAVLLVLNDFKVVLTTTTLTTVWAFLPLLASSGIIGQFIKSIPITVSTTLIASLFIALFINHPLAAVLERIRLTKNFFYAWCAILLGGIGLAAWTRSLPGYIAAGVLAIVFVASTAWFLSKGKSKLEQNAALAEREWLDDDLIKEKLRNQALHGGEGFLGSLMHGVVHFDRVIPWYEAGLKRILASRFSRTLTLVTVFLMFCGAVALPATGTVPSEFFPLTDSNQVFVNITAPTGLKLDQTDQIVKHVEQHILETKEVVSFSTLVGAAGSNSTLGSGSFSNPSNVASITIKLTEPEDREIKSYEIADELRKKLNDITEATLAVDTQKSGPPSGADFEAQIAGEDLEQLDKITHDLKPKLESIKGVTNADISLKSSPAEYTFTLDPARLELYSLNAAYVGSVLRTAINGTEITTVIRGGDETKVMARFEADKIPDLQAIQNLQIINLRKQPVFLKDVAKIELKPSVDSITHIDKKRTVVLTASVTKENRPAEVVKEFQDKVAKDYPMPDGYTISYGGQNETNAESVASIIRAMLIAALLIVSTLVIQFNSFRQALIVLVTIPLALIGVFFGLAVTGITLSFPGLIGIVALFGIVVKNAIILVDKINLNIKSGILFKDAIVDAGKSRLEAIFITSICTIVGIIPVTLSNETWRALGSAVIFGLMLSSFFTLFIVPTLYMALVKDKPRKNQGPVCEPEQGSRAEF
ncbi:MAG: efflux RND transporter permease subunit [Patescibacteria group bacterium]